MREIFVVAKEVLKNLWVEGRKGYFVRSEDKIVLLTVGRNSHASTSFYFGNCARKPW